MTLAESKHVGNLITALRETLTYLTDRSREHYEFEFPSQAAARGAAVAIFQWQNSGAERPPPSISKADLRAGIYDFARPSAQIRAYPQVASVAILQHAKVASEGLEEGSLLIALIALRGLLERISVLVDNQRRISGRLDAEELEFNDILQASELIMKTLYSTRVDWHALAGSNLSSMDQKDLPYKRKDLTADMTARNILSSLDVLNKQVAGSRVAYDVLCEFLHPNIGDLVSGTLKIQTHDDQWGTRHVRRVVGVGPTGLEKQYDFARVLDGVFKISAEIVSLVPEVLSDLDVLAARVSKATRKAQHALIRKQRDLFLRSDACPCLSGKTIRACAPMALKR